MPAHGLNIAARADRGLNFHTALDGAHASPRTSEGQIKSLLHFFVLEAVTSASAPEPRLLIDNATSVNEVVCIGRRIILQLTTQKVVVYCFGRQLLVAEFFAEDLHEHVGRERPHVLAISSEVDSGDGCAKRGDSEEIVHILFIIFIFD